jgi:drug/metabolite transporter superfamily protein YnfA
MMRTGLIYVVAALAEIAGCFSVWAWARAGKRAWAIAHHAVTRVGSTVTGSPAS